MCHINKELHVSLERRNNSYSTWLGQHGQVNILDNFPYGAATTFLLLFTKWEVN